MEGFFNEVETKTVEVQLSSRAQEASRALADAKDAFADAGIVATNEDIRSLAVSFLISASNLNLEEVRASNRSNGYSASKVTTSTVTTPTIAVNSVSSRAPVNPDAVEVPDNVRKLIPDGVLSDNGGGKYGKTGKLLPRYSIVGASRQSCAFENSDGTLRWMDVSQKFVPKTKF
jgi:hypothetical protein